MTLQISLGMKCRGLVSCVKKPEIREGMITSSGLRLFRPNANSIPEVKFAFLTDWRFYTPEDYEKFTEFMPSDFRIIGPPERQNSFGYCLERIGKREYCNGERECSELYRALCETGFIPINSNPQLLKGDIIINFRNNVRQFEGGIEEIEKEAIHAGFYCGNGNVFSRWSYKRLYGSPILGHPADDFPQRYFEKNADRFSRVVFRKS